MYTPNFGNEARSLVTSTVGQARSALMRRRSTRVVILYILVTMLAFALAGFIGHAVVIYDFAPSNSNISLWSYSIVLAVVFVFGLLHVSAMRSAMSWIRRDDYLLSTLMTLLFAAIGSLTLFFLSFSPKIFSTLNTQEFKGNVRPLLSTAMIFPLPYFIQWAFEAFERIPPKIYKIWKYNPLIRLPALTERDRNNTKVVTFVLDVHYGEPNPYDMRSKIPDVMLVGDGFKLTIDEDNRKNPNRQIQIGTQKGEFFEWYFYVRRSWWRPYRFVDPYKTVEENQLRDGDRIISRRRLPTPTRAGR